jgi:hypothetical protein
MVKMRNAYNILLENMKGKRPFGIPNIRIDLRKIGWEEVAGFIYLGYGSVVGPCEHCVNP